MVLSLKWYLAGEASVDDDSEGPKIARVATLLGIDHLRRDVVLRADDVLFLGWNLLDEADFGRVVAGIRRFQEIIGDAGDLRVGGVTGDVTYVGDRSVFR